jgi:hypothetical protein
MNPFTLYTIQARLAMATYAMWLGAATATWKGKP